MAAADSIGGRDREGLAAWPRHPGRQDLQPLVERFVAFVYSSAYRRTGSAEQAQEVTRAVFLVLARHAPRRRRKEALLAGWLFHVTTLACRKLPGRSGPPILSRWPWVRNARAHQGPAVAPLSQRLAPEIDAAVQRLGSAQRDVLLLRLFLGQDGQAAASLLRTSERRAGQRLERGLSRLARHLRRRGVEAEPAALAQFCSAEGCAVPLPEGLTAGILDALDQTLARRPCPGLARRTWRALAWTRWRRRFLVGVPTLFLLLVAAAGTAWYIDSLTGHSRLLSLFFVWAVKHERKTVPGLAQPARPWPADASSPRLNAAAVRTAHDLYQTTNIWLAHLKFSAAQWGSVQPKRIEPLPHFLRPDGTVLLRHPEAQRSGLAGVLGFDFNWAHADLEFGGVTFTNVAARLKGNGTYLSSLYADKRSFKVDLNKFTKGQKLGEADELSFNNLVNDHSCLSDALAYEFFREAGVPAPRTAYAYLSVSVDGQWERKPLGLYVMVEPIDENFALERFGSKRIPVFKPVTYELFKHLGDDWAAYAAIYDLKTRATAAQQQRVIQFARLVTFADEAAFAAQVADFLDLESFARYLACEVLLSNYDSLLANGQNFYLFLDPRSNRFGFIPWDLDLAWGGFFLLGSTRERERASIWHPWVGQNRFLERVLAVEAFRSLYRAQLEALLARLLVPNRLRQRIDELAPLLRGPIAAESDFRLRKFEDAISDQRPKPAPDPHAQGAGANRPAHQLKKFIVARAKSVREQLDGRSEGVILERHGRK